MTRLSWGTPGERFYEDGVDQGVLYVDEVGYVWNGLVSVSEAPSGGEARSYYIDGLKYLNLIVGEEYEATITAVSAPPEFDRCEGVKSLYQGLFVTQQRRKDFGFTYRTMIGSDLDPDHGYKIHIVYNALAAASERNNNTRSDSVELTPRSWFISATPPAAFGFGYKPSAHFVVDSRFTPGEILTELENILYGSEEADARIPLQSEILSLFEVYATVKVTDHGDGTFSVEGPDEAVYMTDDTTFAIDWPSAVQQDGVSYTVHSL